MRAGILLIWTLVLFFSILSGPATSLEKGEGPTLLTAERTTEPITIDGIAEEAPWDSARPLTVRAKYGGIGTVDVEVKALYDDEYIYLYTRWKDDEENASKGIWVYNATNGTWNTSENEDRIAFMWNINDSIRGFNIAGCIITCHGDRKLTEFPDEEADIWHWMAARSNPMGYCDDEYLNNSLTPYEGREDKLVARYGDPKDAGGYERNINEDETGPKYYEPAPDDERDAQFLLRSEIESGEAVEITDRTVFEDGETVPGYILERPAGSRGDIDASGLWRDGYWSVEFRRKLLTGHPHDVQFDTGNLYRFGVAVMDNEGGFEAAGRGHSFELYAKTLEFGGLGSEEVAQMGLVKDYLTTAKAYAARGEGGLAVSEINYALALFEDIRDEAASVDPKLYIRMKDRFTRAKRIPSQENIDALINDAELMILTFQGKSEPPKATLFQTFLVMWGKFQTYIFVLLALLALYPIYRTVKIGRKPVFRKMSIFLSLVIAPVFLEGLGRLGGVLGMPVLYGFSFMTSEYATLLWAVLMFVALFYARAGFGEVDQNIQTLEKREEELTDAVEQLQQEIADRVQAEEALRWSKEFVETVLNSMQDAVSIINVKDFKIVGVNKTFLDQFGLKEEDAIGKICHELTHHRDEPCCLPDERCPLMETAVTGEHASEEHIHYQKDGKRVYVEVSTSPIKDEDGKVVQVVHVARDVTERKKAEEQIRESLRVKEVLLKEIHHRVKNNMQVISSLLSLQSRYTSDEDHKAMFKESQNQIKSMVLVHELLYQSKDLARIDFNDYLKKLVHGLVRSFGVDTDRIGFNIDVQGVSLGVDSALPCGLILNELISNSLKYAFPDGRTGEIEILLKKNKGNYLLTYRDNGVGLPDEIDFEDTATLGIRLIKALVEELDGELELDRSDGTTFKIEFPELNE